jgi:hypothetical protein
MTVAMLRPWRSTDPHRITIEAWQRQYLADTYPNLEIITQDDGRDTGHFNISAAFNLARAKTDAEWLWLMGVDHVPKADDLAISLDAVDGYDWINCYDRIRELDECGTRFTLDGRTIPSRWNGEHHHGCVATSLKLIRADVYDDVGGFDETFNGWGHEDNALHAVLCCLHPPALFPPIGHIDSLHHDRSDPTEDQHTIDNWQRYTTLYQPLIDDPDAMRQMLEARCSP